jgi:hypothetical protein
VTGAITMRTRRISTRTGSMPNNPTSNVTLALKVTSEIGLNFCNEQHRSSFRLIIVSVSVKEVARGNCTVGLSGISA